jgi:competence protein ComEA
VPELVRPDPGDPWASRVRRLVEQVSPGRLATAAGALLLVAVASWWLLRTPAPPVEAGLPRAVPPTSGMSALDQPGTTAGELVVQAAGAVEQPGVYRVPAGARVADLVALAVATPDADLQAIGLASLLQDGQRVWVPRAGEVAAGAMVGGPEASVVSGPLDLNTATAAQLDQLPGVGPATSARILEHRAKIGRFQRVEELLDVPGIGPAKLEALEGLVVVR